MYSLSKITDPTFVPISIDEAKAHLRVFHDADDTQIGDMILAAVSRAQDRTGIQIAEATYRLSVPCFPASRQMMLPMVPLVRVDSVAYLDHANTFQTLDTQDYRVLIDSGSIWRISGNWPETNADMPPDSVQVEYVSGMMSAPGQPMWPELRIGILQVVWHLYEHRGEVGTESANAIPHSAESIFESFNVGDEFDRYGFSGERQYSAT